RAPVRGGAWAPHAPRAGARRARAPPAPRSRGSSGHAPVAQVTACDGARLAFGDDDRGGDVPVVREGQVQVGDLLLLGGAERRAAQPRVGAPAPGAFDGDVLPGAVA